MEKEKRCGLRCALGISCKQLNIISILSEFFLAVKKTIIPKPVSHVFPAQRDVAIGLVASLTNEQSYH